MSDSFPAFAKKIVAFAEGLPEGSSAAAIADAIAQKNIRFEKTLVHKNMVLSAQSLGILSTAARDTIRLIDAKFGRGVLGGQHHTLYRLATAVRALSGSSRGIVLQPEELMDYMIQSMWLNLCQGSYSDTYFMLSNMEKNRKGEAGWIGMTATKMQVTLHIAIVVECLPHEHLTEAKTFLDLFMSPLAYEENFENFVDEVEASGGVSPEGQDDGATAGARRFDKLQDGLSKPNALLAELLRRLYSCEFDPDCKDLATVEGTGHTAAKLGALGEDGCGDLGAALRGWMCSASASQAVVSGSSRAAPTPSLRLLARVNSDEGAAHATDAAQRREAMIAERDSVWKKAQAKRQNLVQIGLAKSKNLAGISAVVKKTGIVNNFKGTLNDSHRLYVLSCDLISEAGPEPWQMGGVSPIPKGEVIDGRLAYLKNSTECDGPNDFTMAFDGRIRKLRPALEGALVAKGKDPEEMWIVFSGAEAFAKRKVALCADTMEVRSY